MKKQQMALRSLLVITSLLLGLSLHAQLVTIHVETPGTLSSYIASNEKDQITSLALTGDLNGTDIRFIREMAGKDVKGHSTLGLLSVLDISGANIIAGGDYYYNDDYSSYYSSDNTIGRVMFYNCNQLTSITIPNSVTSIGAFTFYGCTGLTSITIPNSVISIGTYAFYNCAGLTSVTIPNRVTAIGDYAFQNCSQLTYVTIGNSVTSIGLEVFSGLNSLTEIFVSDENISFSSVDGVLFSKDKSTLISYPNSKSNSYTIPNSVTSIGVGAFSYCSGLTSVTIPNSVTSISESAFYYCSGLKDIICQGSKPASLVGSSCFDGVNRTTCILWVPKSATEDYSSAQGWNSFNSIIEEGTVVEYDVTLQGAGQLLNALGVSNLKHVTKLTISGQINGTDLLLVRSKLPVLRILNMENAEIVSGGVAYYLSYTTTDNQIGTCAFSSCSGLTSLTIPNSITSIGRSAFSSCRGLTSVTIPNSVISIGDYAFDVCTGLTSVTIGNSVTSIGKEAFLYCSGLTSVTIPNSVTSIGSSAFSGCSALTSVSIGDSVTSIGDYAFSGCSALKELLVSEENTSFCSVNKVLFSKDESTLVLYPNSKSNSYTIPNSVTSIGNYAFSGCSGLTSVTIPYSVTLIGSSAFFGCSGLTSVTIPNSVTLIGSSAFSGCSELTLITIPNSVTSIGDNAFYYCRGLKEIHNNNAIPQKVNSYVFGEVNKSTCKLYVPKGSLSYYYFAPIWSEFTNIIEEDITSNAQIQSSNIKVYTEAEAIVIEGAESGETISVYTESGALVQTTYATEDIVRINVPTGHVYLVKTEEKTFKIAL